MSSDKYEPDPPGYVPVFKYFDRIISEKVSGLKDLMAEREKAALLAAQALITKDGQEQLAKFVLKQEMGDRITLIQDQITGPLGLELRMRTVEFESHGALDREKRISLLEQSKGVMDAKMLMIIIGLSAFITGIVTAILHIVFKS